MAIYMRTLVIIGNKHEIYKKVINCFSFTDNKMFERT